MADSRRIRLFSIASASALLAALTLWTGLSRAEDPGSTFDHTYTATTETDFILPLGVTAIDVVAVGGRGGNVSNSNSNPVSTAIGGVGARVTGRLSNLTPGNTVYLEVGGNGSAGSIHSAGPGGFNGGGQASVETTAGDHFYNPGAGGGGASDIRTAPRDDGLSPDPRLIVAGGGGGGGHAVNSNSAAGGNGGAGFSGSGASGGNGAQGAVTGGGGGTGGSSAGGGAAGTAGTGIAGTAGDLGQGGNGGSSPNNNPAGGGGGGGGGLYGGGGGRGGSGSSFTGGGGGGGGSSKIPAGGSIAVAPGGSNGSIEVSYTIPGTDIDSGPSGPVDTTAPSFTFASSEDGASFECRLDSDDDADFAPCSAQFTTPDLADGQHTLDVRAVNSMGNFDPSPASRSFTVDTVAPTTTITSGPEGPTTSPTPTFTYSSEPGSSFACAIDSAALAGCGADGFTAPVLALGSHTFSVRATDAAGNVETTPVARSFSVIAAPVTQGAGGKAKCKKKKHKRAAAAKKHKKKCKKKGKKK